MVRQPGDDGLVGRPVAQRGVRHLDGLQDRRRLAARRGASGWTSRPARARRWRSTRCVSAHPIRAEIKNAEEAGESFDAITYEKGGAVLRMLEGFLGEDRFRDGIRLYMRRHREANATADDLWGALGEASGQPILEHGQRLDPPDRLSAGRACRSSAAPAAQTSVDAERSGGSSPSRAPPRAGRADALAGPDRAALPRRGRRSRSSRCCSREAAARVPLAAEGAVAWCIGNAEARGFYRAAYDPRRRWRGCCPRWASCARPSGWRWSPTQWALVRAGEATIERLPGAGRQPARRDRPRRARRARRAAVGDRAPLPRRRGSRRASARSSPSCSARRRPALGWAPAPGALEDDETRLRRAVLLRALVLLARVPGAVAEARGAGSPARRGGAPARSIRTCSTSS